MDLIWFKVKKQLKRERACTTYYPYFATGATLGKERETKVRWKKILGVIEKKNLFFFTAHRGDREYKSKVKSSPHALNYNTPAPRELNSIGHISGCRRSLRTIDQPISPQIA
jgi:hypothetical protein